MKLCNEHCEPLCDFCKNFKEMDELEDCFSDGICIVTNEEVSRCDYCKENFICFRIKEE